MKRSLYRLLPFLCLAALATDPATAGTASKQDKALAAATTASLPEFIDFLKRPNVAHKPGPDMRHNADWVEAAFKRRGFATRQLEDGETPMVFAEWPGNSKARKTVLFYAHMDGQAVFPKEWDQPDPFQPVLKRKLADGRWETLPIEALTGGPVDPEWRLFARSAADDKAPIVMLLAAMDAMKAQGKSPSINVKIILDSQEESGSPTLKDVIDRNRSLLTADAVVMLDGPMHASNRPTLVFGHRGIGVFTLTLFGPRGDLHSGHYGNYAPNPAQALATLLAGMKDADGRVLIPGFYDGVDRSDATRHVLASVPDDEAAMRARIGIAAAERLGANYQEAINYPSLNITAMKSGEIASQRSILPAQAAASFDIRTLPTTPFDRQVDLVRQWVAAQGYHLVDDVPTEEDRRRYPKLASLKAGVSTAALMTPLDASIGVWAAKAFRRQFKQEPVRIPVMGGTVPTAPLVEALKVPVLLVPLVNNDNNQHAANENLRLGNYVEGVKAIYSLLNQPVTD